MSSAPLADAVVALAPNFAHLVTSRKNGSPRVAVTWVDVDDDGHVVLDGARDRWWYRDLVRHPSATVTVVNHDNPDEYAVIHGRLVAYDAHGADDHTDFLAKKYLGEEVYPWRTADEERVPCLIGAERVDHCAG
ncbi:MAG TPA: pyridoxamine 5'-phosphate oxidase family protein [Baekduia sp.]|nr:pyridoxamine 5'-phosphate oxidase family protein [Baekduia sp.]